MKFKEVRKRWTGLGLAVILSVSAAIPAMADPGTSVSSASVLQEQTEDVPASSDSAVFADEAAQNPEMNLQDSALPETPSQEITDDADPSASDAVEDVEPETTDASDSVETEAATDPDEKPVLELTDTYGNEKTFTVTAKNITLASGEHLLAAVWSEEKGQDDLNWYSLTYNSQENAYKTNFDIANHKTNGQYHVHLYVFKNSGPQFIDKTTFTISPVTSEKLEVTDVQPDGTAIVTISGVYAPSGIKEVQFPIWSASNQSDIVWYTGNKIAEGVYQIKLDIAKHAYHYGTYQIHTYGTNGIGCRNFLQKTTIEFTRGEVDFRAEAASKGYTLKASNLETRDASRVQIAIWSSDKGQDDLIWLDINPNASGNVTANWVPKEFGEHYLHCYVRTKSGQMIFQKGITVDVKGPKIGKMDITTNPESGAFTIKLTDVVEPSLIKTVLVPVWSDPKQSDIVWYTATKQADGSYSVSGNISKHAYNLGTYQAHVYLTDINGKNAIQLTSPFDMKASCSSVTVIEDAENATYTASAENVLVPAGASSLSFAVWSDDKGQDDLVWYTATNTSGTWTAPIQLSKHISGGKYFVHCYADTKTGKKVFLGGTEFTVNLSAKASVTVTATDEKEASITLQIHVDEKSAPIEKLLVPVWVNADKKDQYTYTAAKESDDTWTVTVKAANHGYHFGTYSIHVDAVFTNGLSIPAADFTTDFAPERFLSIEKTEKGKRLVKISNLPSTVQKVTFPTWSSANGQDDICWYNGKKNADGSWSAEITSANLKHAGTVITHCYVDDGFSGVVESEFTDDEMQTVGSTKVHQYAQQLINANGGDLYRIYKWVVNSYRYTTKPVPVPYPDGYTRQEFYFTDAYETHVTNCFGFAATFYWCAKEMGYDVKLIEGRVRYRSGAYGPHGWVEVKKDGATYICDPELEYEKSVNSYMVTYASSPFSYQPDMPAY